MPALAQMTSVSSFGSSQVTLQFDLDRSIDAAEQDVQSAINAASNLLPRTLPAPPTYSKSNPAERIAPLIWTMKLLADCGLAFPRQFDGIQTRYEPAAGRPHHAHLICSRCGLPIYDSEGPPIRAWPKHGSYEYRFHPVCLGAATA